MREGDAKIQAAILGI